MLPIRLEELDVFVKWNISVARFGSGARRASTMAAPPRCFADNIPWSNIHKIGTLSNTYHSCQGSRFRLAKVINRRSRDTAGVKQFCKIVCDQNSKFPFLVIISTPYGNFVQKLVAQMIFMNDELNIILQLKHLWIGEHLSFCQLLIKNLFNATSKNLN